jgi:hypothetical protein
MFLALAPNRHVDSDASMSFRPGERQMTSVVRLLPPRESCNMRVSFEDRYGTCTSFFDEAMMTLPSTDRDLLMTY